MITIKNTLAGLGFALLSTTGFAKQMTLTNYANIETNLFEHKGIELANLNRFSEKTYVNRNFNMSGIKLNLKNRLPHFSSPSIQFPKINQRAFATDQTPFVKNRRNLYSSLWGFASLNYLYADLVGLMDANVLKQYQAGVVNDISITPNFLTVAAGFMQIPIANVFLPHIIKNDRTLRWVQIASGSVMTLVQTSTLFVGKPTPYYALFSAFEIAATTYITIDAIRWKPNPKKLSHPKHL